MDNKKTDIIIAGGGLAGMSLALQLHNRDPDLDIVIVERNQFPIPNTTAKIGESTVEIGSHYFTEILGLKEHFKKHHLQKHGLRCFFGQSKGDYSEQDELGVSDLFGIPTYQIERGVLENHLFELLTSKGITIVDNATIEDITLGNKKQKVQCKQGDITYGFEGRWVVDAAGRQAIIKNKLGLKKKTAHKGNAIFFRIDKPIIIDEWTSNSQWQNRLKTPGKRWLSTNHLMGAGYWLWIIPLGSGASSIGIVLDDKALADSNIQSFEDTMAWLRKEQPRCAKALEDANLLDFNIVQDYSFGCKKMFSENGWALTGEAGAFTDPFYAPGSDFIALNNTFITHLIERDTEGKDIRLDSTVFHMFYNSFFENTLSLYVNQYGGFGDRKMMSIKLVWDYAYYWGVLTLLFFKGTITDIDLMRKLNPSLIRAQRLNDKMQQLLTDRAQKRLVLPAKGLFMDQFLIPCLTEFNDVLKSDTIDTEQALESNIIIMEKMLPYFEEMLQDEPSKNISEDEKALLGEYRLSVLA